MVIAPTRGGDNKSTFDGAPAVYWLMRYQVQTDDLSEKFRWEWRDGKRPCGLAVEIREMIVGTEEIRAARRNLLAEFPALDRSADPTPDQSPAN